MKHFIKNLSIILLILALVIGNNFVYATGEGVAISTMLPLTSNMQLENLNINISIVYQDTYHENVLLAGEEVTLELITQNMGEDDKKIQFLLGLYATNENMCGVAFKDVIIKAGESECVVITKMIPENIVLKNAILYAWDNYNNTEPSIALTLNPTVTDYYGNSHAEATLLGDLYKAISGQIDTKDDVDFIKFIAPENQSYTFSFLTGDDIKASLYDSSQNLLVDKLTQFDKRLVKDQTYYIKFEANVPRQYTFLIQENSLNLSVVTDEVYKIPIVRSKNGEHFTVSFDMEYFNLDTSYIPEENVQLEEKTNSTVKLLYSGTGKFVSTLPLRAKRTGNTKIAIEESN